MVNFKTYQKDLLRSLLFLSPLLGIFIILGLYREDLEDDVSLARGTLSQIETEIEKLNQDATFLKENNEKYETLIAQGWFLPLDRMNAAHVIETIASETNLNEVNYDLMALDPQKNHPGTNGNIVQLSFSGVLDAHVFEFIEKLDQKLPGHIVPESLSLTRYEPISRDSLESMRHFNRPNFVSGEYHFRWLVDETPQP